ncbi:MAG: DUF4381 domain-containing protein [Thiothrix sp.]|nr:DUF4381 domain-containing protein [Thiothrix sp.]HPQ95260.1 DUF4381 domain-containing protein [Thiolinea sp.]
MNPDLPLRDIHLPGGISLWPPAPGWWLLAALVLLLVFWLLHLAWRWWQRRRARKALLQPALQELERLEALYRDDPQTLLRELSGLMRRIAITFEGRRVTAGLTGARWLAFLNRQSGEPLFSEKFAHTLTVAPYQQQSEADVSALAGEIRRWIRQQETGHV